MAVALWHFSYCANSSLPRMAWCAKLTQSNRTIVVEHGPWVETLDAFFVEGAWPGVFPEGGFDKAAVFCGSGAVVRGETVHFVPASFPTERLHSLELGSETYVSNSLCYLLKATGSDLSLEYGFYETDLSTVLGGYDRAIRRVPLAAGRYVNLHDCDGLSFGPNDEKTSFARPHPPAFDSYDAYRDYLKSTLLDLDANARHPTRAVTFDPMGMLSTGYDSPACMALARDIGCNEAINFPSARSGSSDDATDIAKALQISLLQFERDDYHGCNDFPEAEFLATGNGLDDVVLAPLSNTLSKHYLVKGDFGDAMWGLVAGYPDKHRYGRSTTGGVGGSMSEFRLRVGFISLPIPWLTMHRLPEIHLISQSETMRAFCLGNTGYDRPIPRRLAEEAGVPRHSFGVVKKAATQPIGGETGEWERRMTAKSWKDFCSFRQQHKGAVRPAFVRRLYEEAHRRAFIQFRYGRLSRILARLRLLGMAKRLDLDIPNAVAGTMTGKDLALLFHWAVNKTLPRYASTRFPKLGE